MRPASAVRRYQALQAASKIASYRIVMQPVRKEAFLEVVVQFGNP